jgi:hypothetical protein
MTLFLLFRLRFFENFVVIVVEEFVHFSFELGLLSEALHLLKLF